MLRPPPPWLHLGTSMLCLGAGTWVALVAVEYLVDGDGHRGWPRVFLACLDFTVSGWNFELWRRAKWPS